MLQLSLFALILASTWFRETLHDGWGQSFEIDKVIYEGKSPYSESLVFENSVFGRVLVLDGCVQLTEKDEPFYHEMIAHVPLFTHPNPSKVLIIGGGDGGTAREVLKHPSVTSVKLVEIDSEVINLSKKYFQSVCKGVFEDPRLEVLIEDGAVFVANSEAQFDVIIVDGCDPEGPARILFEKPFFEDCSRCLKEGGILVNHSSVPFMQKEPISLTEQNLTKAFPYTMYYHAVVPTYVGGSFLFCLASQDPILERIDTKEIKKRLECFSSKMKVYNHRLHLASFSLPNYLLKEIGH